MKQNLSPYKLQDIQQATDAQLIMWLRMRFNSTVYDNIERELKKRGIL